MSTSGPVPGPYNDFFLPIRKDRSESNSIPDNAPVWDIWERAYIKEAIGLFLGLPVARNRVGQFKSDAKNNLANRYFNFRKQRGSKAYTLILIPDTEIKAYSTDNSNGNSWGEIIVKKNSISFSVPRTVKVSEMMAWLTNPEMISILNGSLGDAATWQGNAEAEGYKNIIALITPSDRRHPVRVLTAKDQPLVDYAEEPATEVEGEKGIFG